MGGDLAAVLAATYDVRTPLYTARLLLTMTAVTSTMTGNRRVEEALRAAATTDNLDQSKSQAPVREGAM